MLKAFHPADYIDLDLLEPVAKGGFREIFAVPDRPDLLIKVKLPVGSPRPTRLFEKLMHHFFPRSVHRTLFREIQFEADFINRIGVARHPIPVAKCMGIVQTSRGLGMIVEKIADDAGGLAPTLAQMDRADITDDILDRLNAFIHRIFVLDLVMSDLHVRNIVYGQSGADKKFVLVDGYGDPNLIPLRSWSKVVNRRLLNKSVRDLAHTLNMDWDPETHHLRHKTGS